MAAPLDDDLRARLDRYLLGQLSGRERREIETLLFDGDAFLDAVREREDDLIDRYLAGSLNSADREAFEHTFAAPASRRERIAFARALERQLATRRSPDAAAAPSAGAAAPMDRERRPAARRAAILAGAIAATLAIGLLWAALRGPLAHRTDVPLPGGGAVAPNPPVATFLLHAIELRRSEGRLPRLQIPRDAALVRFEAELDAPPVDDDQAVSLRRVGGAVVWQGRARADRARGRVTVELPAALVVPGDYVLTVSPAGKATDSSPEYPFRITPRD